MLGLDLALSRQRLPHPIKTGADTRPLTAQPATRSRFRLAHAPSKTGSISKFRCGKLSISDALLPIRSVLKMQALAANLQCLPAGLS